jgi:hypothetical protein
MAVSAGLAGASASLKSIPGISRLRSLDNVLRTLRQICPDQFAPYCSREFLQNMVAGLVML